MRQTRIALLLTLTLLVGGGTLAAQTAPPPPVAIDAPAVVRLYVRDRDHLNAVAGELDIWEAHPEELYVVAAVTPAQYRWLASLGYRLEIEAEKTEVLEMKAVLDPRFYYFDDHYTNPNGLYVVDFLQDINAAYPGLTELIDIGEAWLAGQPGEHDRDIWVLRITNEDSAYGPIEDKPAFFLFATIHAREVAVPELAIRYIKYLTEGYDSAGGYGLDPDATWLVNHNVAYVLVMQNPDGHVYNEQNTSNFHRKNMNSTACGGGNLGVDLNRNHSFLWGCCGGSSGAPCSETYRGPSRGSEPETQAFEGYFAEVMRDQNGPNGDDEIPPAAPITTTGIFITLHSYSDLVLWPWGVDDYGLSPNYAQMETIGHKFAYYNGYDPSATIWYDVDGATDDWTYGKFGIPSYTFEVGPSGGDCGGFFPDYECIDGHAGRDFWAENWLAFLYAHKIARAPYMTTYGPDAEELAVATDAVPLGASVQLTATIADQRYTGDTLQPTTAAEYFVDAPGADGDGIPMAPADGGWGETSEQVTATVDVSGLSLGQHYILVHGQNGGGDWGPFTAVFVTVVTPTTYGVALTPTTATQSGTPGAMVTYTLALENTGSITDTYTIGVTATWPTTPSLTSTGPVGPGGRLDLPIAVAIPASASDGDWDAGMVTASGVVSASSVLTTTATLCADVAIINLTSDSPVVLGETMHCSATVTGQTVITYTWGLGDGTPPLIGVGLDVISHTYHTAGSYTVTLEAANGCPSSDSRSITVEAAATTRIYLPIVRLPTLDL